MNKEVSMSRDTGMSKQMGMSNGHGGHLYMQTNEVRNAIVHYHRSANGTLTEVERVATRGGGSGTFKPISGQESAPNAFEGAGRVILSPDRKFLFATNGGDNLAATFSPELADLTIYVIDVAEGEKIPRKGGPGITRSDILVINKIDLAPFVGANLAVMESDTLRMRVNRPFVFTNLKSGEGVEQIATFIVDNSGLAKAAA